jgi:hypothetical protein
MFAVKIFESHDPGPHFRLNPNRNEHPNCNVHILIGLIYQLLINSILTYSAYHFIGQYVSLCTTHGIFTHALAHLPYNSRHKFSRIFLKNGFLLQRIRWLAEMFILPPFETLHLAYRLTSCTLWRKYFPPL